MIIIEVNRKKVKTTREFESILKKTQSGDEVILLIRREFEDQVQDTIVPIKVR
jgi:serine protease Do